MTHLLHFFHELRRRRVLQVVVLYVVVAWCVIEVAGMAIQAEQLGRVSLKDVWITAYFGFPIALIAGWFYDITRHGIVRTPPANADPSFDPSLRQRDYLLLAILVVVWIAPSVELYTPAPLNKSVAVFPFDNTGHDPENAGIAYGIYDDLMTQLGKLGDLTVISPPSVAKIPADMSLSQIGLSLGVSFIVKGSVERVLDTIRVKVTLFEAETERQAWTDSFDRTLTTQSLFDMRDEITRTISHRLQARITPREQDQLNKVPTKSLDAYQAYMMGRRGLAKRNVPSMKAAIGQFERAIELDPHFVQAYANLAITYFQLNNYAAISFAEYKEKAIPLIESALELDELVGEVEIAAALVIDDSDATLRRGIELNPNNADAHSWYAQSLDTRTQTEEKLRALRKAIDLDPLSGPTNMVLANVLTDLDRLDEAEQQYKRTIEVAPEYSTGYQALGFFYLGQGHFDKHIRWSLRGLQHTPESPSTLVFTGVFFFDLNDDATAEALIEKANAMAPDTFWTLQGLRGLARFRGDLSLTSEYTKKMASTGIDPWYLKLAHAEDAYLSKDYTRAVELIEKAYPDWVDGHAKDILSQDMSNADSLFMGYYNHTLMETGRRDRGRALLAQAKLNLESQSDPWLGWVFVHATEKNDAAALAALKDVVDKQVPIHWWYLTELPVFERLWSKPEFQILIDEIEAELDQQRENLRNDPEVQAMLAKLLATQESTDARAKLP